MIYARRVGLAEDVAYPLNPSSSQATRSYPGKAKAMNPRPWMKQCCLWRERKLSPFHTPSTGLHQFPLPFQQKKKNKDVRNRDQH